MNCSQLSKLSKRLLVSRGQVGGLELFGQIVAKASPKVSNDQLVTVLLEASDDPSIHVVSYVVGKRTKEIYYYNPNQKKVVVGK